MRLIHTADWHLGRVFHGVHLTDDQAHLLEGFCRLVQEAKPHAVLISGDVYDRAVPPADAVALLDDVLCRLAVDLDTQVIVIPGNHDSAERLGFGSRAMAGRGIHICGGLDRFDPALILEDEHGPVHIWALPFADPPLVRHHLGSDDIRTHDDAMQALTSRIRQSPHWQRPGRRVLLAHCFVAGSTTSDSERPLSIGGADQVSSECFDGFDYVALGHLHRPQFAGSEPVRYSGSLMKYSFAEAEHQKSVSVVELGPEGLSQTDQIALPPRRDVRCVVGSMQQILDRAGDDPSCEDYILVTLTDDGPILDAMGRIRERYPNALHIERPALLRRSDEPASRADPRQADQTVLFEAFFAQATDEKLTESQRQAYQGVLEDLHKEGL